MNKINPDVIEATFDQSVEIFDATLVLVASQLKQAISTVDVIEDRRKRETILSLHKERLVRVRAFQDAVKEMKLPSILDWAKERAQDGK
jgi:hypothetical protein